MPIVACALLLALAPAQDVASDEEAPADAMDPMADSFEAVVRPFLESHCLSCHGMEEAQGDLVLARFVDEPTMIAEPAVWDAVRDRLVFREMPPATEPQPGDAEVARVLSWLEDSALGRTLAELEQAQGEGERPGTVIRRLNRREYQNTIRDLFGVDFDAHAVLPEDGVAHGFDNVAEALSLPTLLLEKYLVAAETVARRALPTGDLDQVPSVRLTAEHLRGEGRIRARGGSFNINTSHAVHGAITVDREGEYVLRASAWGQQAGPDPVRMDLRIDRKPVERFDVLAEGGEAEIYEVRVRLKPGPHRVGVFFANDYYRPDDPDPGQRDRNLILEWIEFAGPVDQPLATPFRRELEDLARASLAERVARMARRVYRRPVGADEVQGLLAVSAAEDADANRLQDALVAALVSPSFLFRVEHGAAGANGWAAHELASRLSYFLWSSTPDEALLELADKDALHNGVVLDAEVARMLRDPRASALVDGFAFQWLQIRRVERIRPDPVRFASFDDELREAMLAETALFLEAILREDRPLTELIDADFTFVNERLAAHYGLPGVRGPRMRRVRLTDPARGGVVTQASVLLASSNPTRTSPVLRGKWILDSILGAPPPPPPPGVGDLDDSREAVRNASVRERLSQHRLDPACAACHAGMDELGFALENFDAVGAWRETDGRFPVDATGTLPDGRSFDGPAELKRLLRDDDAFLRAFATKLLVYALGRTPTRREQRALDELLASWPDRAPTMHELVRGLVGLDAFLAR